MNKLNEYESVFLLRNTTKDEYKTMLDELMKRIKKIVTIDTIEELGLRNLAYEIRKNKQAYYVIINFKATSDDVAELERIYRITDDILKFIVVRKED